MGIKHTCIHFDGVGIYTPQYHNKYLTGDHPDGLYYQRREFQDGGYRGAVLMYKNGYWRPLGGNVGVNGSPYSDVRCPHLDIHKCIRTQWEYKLEHIWYTKPDPYMEVFSIPCGSTDPEQAANLLLGPSALIPLLYFNLCLMVILL